MNIFFIDMDPYTAAEMMVDKHVVKMIVETAQILSTAHRLLDGRLVNIVVNGRNKKHYVLDDARESQMYKVTHANHPSTVWGRTSVENYNWLVDHFHGLLREYTYRYGKVHKCQAMLLNLQSPPLNLKAYDWTQPPSCMDDEYKVGDLVANYQEYYRRGKAHIHNWKFRHPPAWINNEVTNAI